MSTEPPFIRRFYCVKAVKVLTEMFFVSISFFTGIDGEYIIGSYDIFFIFYFHSATKHLEECISVICSDTNSSSYKIHNTTHKRIGQLSRLVNLFPNHPSKSSRLPVSVT
jgi:hypothetical protein